MQFRQYCRASFSICPTVFGLFDVLVRGQPEHLFDLPLRNANVYFAGAGHYFAQTHTPFGFHQHPVIFLQNEMAAVEIIYFAFRAEPYSDDFLYRIDFLRIWSSVTSSVRSRFPFLSKVLRAFSIHSSFPNMD